MLEKPPADTHLHRRDPGICRRGVAQRRPARGCANRAPTRDRFCSRAPRTCGEFSRGPMLGFIVGSPSQRTRRRKPSSFVAQDPAFARRARKGPLEALCEDRCRCTMRVPVSARGLGEELSIQRSALPEGADSERAVSAMPNPRLHLSNLRDGHGRSTCRCGFIGSAPLPRISSKKPTTTPGLAAHRSGQCPADCVHFQLAMLAYNLNCWLVALQPGRKDALP